MAERYKRLFLATENIYSKGSPVIILASALLKDTQTGNVLAQLKMKSISDKPIKAVSVNVFLLDTSGQPLDEAVAYEYLDLDVQRDGEFGQKTGIPIPNSAARAFTVEIAKVVFSDNCIWYSSGENWYSVKAPVSVETYFNDNELAKQYRIVFGEDAIVFPCKDDNLWFCTCGKINRAEEAICHSCGKQLVKLFSLDEEALERAKTNRLQDEENTRSIRRGKSIKNIKILGISLAVLLVIIGALIGFKEYKEIQSWDKNGPPRDYYKSITAMLPMSGSREVYKTSTTFYRWNISFCTDTESRKIKAGATRQLRSTNTLVDGGLITNHFFRDQLLEWDPDYQTYTMKLNGNTYGVAFSTDSVTVSLLSGNDDTVLFCGKYSTSN